jgi:hypothetical protein
MPGAVERAHMVSLSWKIDMMCEYLNRFSKDTDLNQDPIPLPLPQKGKGSPSLFGEGFRVG